MGVAFIFVSGVPALMQMGVIGENGRVGYGSLIAMTVMCGFWGLGFAVPFRSIFILKLARQLNLQFPLGTAAAITIRTLHHKSDTAGARLNIITLAWSFGISLVWAVGSSYAPGILYNWNVFWWIYKWGGTGIISAVSWSWISWQWSPSMLGIGAFVGLNSSLSFLLGAVLAWGIIGPILVATGEATGLPMSPDYPGLMTYNVLDPTTFVTNPSPRYWILWPAVFLMLSVSLTTIAFEAKSLWKLVRYGASRIKSVVQEKIGHNNQTSDSVARPERLMQDDQGLPDPVSKEYHVRWWEWSTMAAGAFLVSMLLMHFLYGIDGGMGILHLFMGLFWSFVVIQVFAATGFTPIATVAKGSQFVTGGILRDQTASIGYNNAVVSNLIGATVTGGAAQQAAELVQDFRTGFLLCTPMRAQWYAQVVGTLSSVFFLPGLFLLFVTAWPCIVDPAATTCQFAIPAVTAWRIITQAILSPTMPLSQSSWITCIVFAVVGIATTCLQKWVSGHKKWGHLEAFIPNMAVVGLSMTVPGSTLSMTMALGAVASALWAKFGKASHAKLMFAVAAGGIAGEGVAYVVLGVLQIAEVGGPTWYGTKIGCIAEMC